MEICTPPEPKRKALSEYWLNVAATAKTLKDEEFVRVGPYSVGVATNIRNGLYPAFLPKRGLDDDQKKTYMADHWVITTRKSGPSRTHIFIRWMGDGCGCEFCR